VIPGDIAGPVAVTAAVYYQSVEAVAATKLLGNLADTDLDFRLEPCVLGGLCDGRRPSVEPAVVEGSPPVPMEVRSWVIGINGLSTGRPLAIDMYPAPNARNVYRDVVVKTFLSEPLTGLDATTFTLRDRQGALVPSSIDQIGDGTWALFPSSVFLKADETYTASIDGHLCRADGSCTTVKRVWRFTIAADDATAAGDTRVREGFRHPRGSP